MTSSATRTRKVNNNSILRAFQSPTRSFRSMVRRLDVQNWSYTVDRQTRSTGSTSKELIPVLQEMREAVPRVGQDNSRLQRRSLLDAESINTSPQTFHRH